ncbi:uncharacterized protein BO72DRAFT_293346 [Aspergillus fijiensis CBS 313.89]|uniref:Uncharacterized protein n=1 Tax=Aspergillus fijiensis CBS 313.89 TaxID=1448319 RepID=A0A8G1RGK5_9EURO|nr:uncharacterized protein BO72DRAFT_293346 [Aspergillus fijiensis CBS 313.89]RAK71997.1 hypothetical protein BO72DRAFT_293346 [Aspergillus fijiensis CBS 313.89]
MSLQGRILRSCRGCRGCSVVEQSPFYLLTETRIWCGLIGSQIHQWRAPITMHATPGKHCYRGDISLMAMRLGSDTGSGDLIYSRVSPANGRSKGDQVLWNEGFLRMFSFLRVPLAVTYEIERFIRASGVGVTHPRAHSRRTPVLATARRPLYSVSPSKRLSLMKLRKYSAVPSERVSCMVPECKIVSTSCHSHRSHHLPAQVNPLVVHNGR